MILHLNEPTYFLFNNHLKFINVFSRLKFENSKICQWHENLGNQYTRKIHKCYFGINFVD